MQYVRRFFPIRSLMLLSFSVIRRAAAVRCGLVYADRRILSLYKTRPRIACIRIIHILSAYIVRIYRIDLGRYSCYDDLAVWKTRDVVFDDLSMWSIFFFFFLRGLIGKHKSFLLLKCRSIFVFYSPFKFCTR